MEIKKIILKEKDFLKSDLLKIFGDSGTERYFGYIIDDFNSKWLGTNKIDTIEEMRRTDASIKAVLNAIKAPLLSTEWYIDGEDKELVEFVENNLFKLKRSWKDFLKEALSYLDFGFYVFEKIYKIGNDGKIYLKDLSPRIPKSILRFELKNGESGIVQQVLTNNPENNVDNLEAEIPMEKLLFLTNDKEGDDITGQSILRSCYIHFKMKNVLYRVSSIAMERYGVGVPVVWIPQGASSEEKSKAEEMVQNLRSNEKSYIVLPGSKEDWQIEILTPQGSGQISQLIDLIKHHDQLILRSVLAQFLGLGAESAGSFALSRDQSSFFLKHVEDKGRYITEQITKQVIEPLIRYNFSDKAEIPKLKFAPLGDIDFSEMANVLKVLRDAGFLDNTDDIKKWVSRTFNLPEFNEKEKLREIEKELTIIEDLMQEYDN